MNFENEVKTVGASNDLIQATAKARKMVVEYGFGEIMKDTSLVELKDYALISGKEIIDDVQKILTNAKDETDSCLSRNKEALLKLVDTFAKEIVVNGEAIQRFFNSNQVE